MHAAPPTPDFLPGDFTGLDIPAHAEALRRGGERFLTAAFQRFGSLTPNNQITKITRFETFSGGNSGHKIVLSVEYANNSKELPRDLFVKFSRDFNDAFRDRRRHELDAEVRLALLSRSRAFPVAIPTAVFADIHTASGTGLLITQRIAYGVNGVEAQHRKCMDHQLANPLEYYRSIVSTLAKLAAAHKSGKLATEVEQFFPFDLDASIAADPIPWSEQQLLERVSLFADFASRYPQLVPANIRTPQFLARMRQDVIRLLREEKAIKRFLHADPDFIALCHYNANIDNAWFWRDAAGTLHCGLLDWGRARQMNVAYALWGALCCASFDIWDSHVDELLDLFVRELHAGGGPRLKPSLLKLHLELYAAVMCLATMMDAPKLVLERSPQIATASSLEDPVFHQHEFARSFLHVFLAFLHLWERRDFGASLDWMQNVQSRKACSPQA